MKWIKNILERRRKFELLQDAVVLLFAHIETEIVDEQRLHYNFKHNFHITKRFDKCLKELLYDI